jgi:hypothetical protein
MIVLECVRRLKSSVVTAKQMSLGFSKFFDRVGLKVGKFLTSLTYLVATLLVYAILSVLTYLWLSFTLSNSGSAGFIAYEISTGGDPFNFRTDLAQHVWLWRWILLFHVLSWLVVPVLAATAVDATYRLLEQRRLELDRRLMSTMINVVVQELKLEEEEAERVVLKARKSMEKVD